MAESHKSKQFDAKKIAKSTEMFLEGLGLTDWAEDPNLRETPARVAKYWSVVANGYDEDPKRHLKLFPSKSRDKVMLINVPLYSFCSHHIALFRGTLSISYIPNGKVLGISKLLRISRVFAKRLQLQEDLTEQIASFLTKHVSKDVAVDIRAEHTCMTIRGVRTPGSKTITTALRGQYKTDPALRAEFLNDIRKEV